MEVTAHPVAGAETDPNAQFADAANAFKAFDNPSVAQPRDDGGRWTREEDEPESEESLNELETTDEAEDEGENEEIDEDGEEPDNGPPMPPSWPADQAEQWAQIPAETRGYIVQREADRERTVQAKFQEIANSRKAAEAEGREEIKNRREALIQAYETVEALYQAPEPDPRAFGYGTQQFNQAAYQDALMQWQQTSQALAHFKQERESMQSQAKEAETAAFKEWKQAHEAEFAPKLLADVPELQDATKAEPLLRELVTYATANGIPEDVFAPEAQDQITAAQLHLLWKAQQYDKLKSAPKAAPKPKPGPAVKPGVSSPRSAQKAARQKKVEDRLNREGSIDAAAAYFKSIF